MRIVIAGVSSGTGKTTIVTGLLAALKARNLKVQAFKVGPDYIDPEFHRMASGSDSHNLDSWLVPKDKLAAVFAMQAKCADINIIEGVMGLYDGGKNDVSSTAQIAKILGAPIVLVINAKSMGESAAAIALGFKTYDPSVNIAGVILNNLGSKSHAELITKAMEKIGIPVLGCMMRRADMSLPERHLGLTPTGEQELVAERIELMRQAVQSDINIDKIIQVASTAPKIEGIDDKFADFLADVRIGIAQDVAFSFYYPASMKVLTDLGAKLIPFSPLHDKELPEVDGLCFGGGFPEMFASELAANHSMLESIRAAHGKGMPIYAECGGFMYMSEAIYDFDKNKFAMVALVPGSCHMQHKLQTVGYVKAQVLADNVLADKGEEFCGHEFHFSTFEPNDAENFPWALQFTKMRTGAQYGGGYAKGNLLASYLHMHFLGNLAAAKNFILACDKYKTGECHAK